MNRFVRVVLEVSVDGENSGFVRIRLWESVLCLGGIRVSIGGDCEILMGIFRGPVRGGDLRRLEHGERGKRKGGSEEGSALHFHFVPIDANATGNVAGLRPRMAL